MSIINKLKIRSGLISDFEQISELCKNIWNGHDFLPDVWINWISKDADSFYVAELNNKIIGVYHYCILGSDSWLETLRVDEKYRRQGIAQYLVSDYIKRMQKLTIHNIRLVTSVKNTASINLFTNNNFVEVLNSQYCSIEFENISSDDVSVEFSLVDDSQKIYSLLVNSRINDSLIPLWWRWWEPTHPTLSELSKNSFILLPESNYSSFIVIQRSKNFGYKDDYQIFFSEMSDIILNSALSFIKNIDPSITNRKIFCIPKINSSQLQILKDMGFKQSTSLVILERRLTST